VREGLALVGAGIAVAEAGATLLVRLAPIGRMLGSLKAAAKIALVLVEIATMRLNCYLSPAAAQASPEPLEGPNGETGTSVAAGKPKDPLPFVSRTYTHTRA
jgi:hypothetical protein